MLLYNLPPDWEVMTIDERIEWHSQRVTKEEPVFDMLEISGVMTCFDPEEIRVRLAVVRGEIRRVESALVLARDEEFQTLWSTLQAMVIVAKQSVAERVKLLNLQCRRVNFKSYPSEDAKLASLKTDAITKLNEAEQVEGDIIRICDRYGADAAPYLIVDPVRDGT